MYTFFFALRVEGAPVGAGPMTQASMQQISFKPQPGPQINAAGSGGLLGGIAQLSPFVTQSGWPVGPGPVGILVPGGYPLTQANLRLALHGVNTQPTGGATASMAGDLDAQLAAVLPRLIGFQTGGG